MPCVQQRYNIEANNLATFPRFSHRDEKFIFLEYRLLFVYLKEKA